MAQLRNAFNGHDVEWTDVGKYAALLCHRHAPRHFENDIRITLYVFVFTEEPYYGSGSGSGAGIDDEDDTGSGLGPYDPHIEDSDDEDDERHLAGKTHNVPVKINSTTNSGTDSSNIGGGSSSSSGPGAVPAPPSIDKDVDVYHEKPIEEIDNDISGHMGSSAPPGTARTPPMSIRRAFITYFVPIYLAWFGGIVCELL